MAVGSEGLKPGDRRPGAHYIPQPKESAAYVGRHTIPVRRMENPERSVTSRPAPPRPLSAAHRWAVVLHSVHTRLEARVEKRCEAARELLSGGRAPLRCPMW